MTQPPAAPRAGQVLTGPLFDEPMRVETVATAGSDGWSLGLVGTRSERFRRVSLSAAELAGLGVQDGGFSYDGDGALLRLGLQARVLGIAWAFDPYFGLSVSRVDPLPHQLEAVYDHLLKPARAASPSASSSSPRPTSPSSGSASCGRSSTRRSSCSRAATCANSSA